MEHDNMTKTHEVTPQENDHMSAQIIGLLTQLIRCLDAETAALQENNRDKAALRSREKILLLQNYEAISRGLQKKPDMLMDLDSSVKLHLKEKILHFERSLNANTNTVSTSKNAVNRLINRIMDRARDAIKSPLQPYNNKGQIMARKSGSSMMPVKLSEEL